MLPQDGELAAACQHHSPECASAIAHAIVGHSKICFDSNAGDEAAYQSCTLEFCSKQCGLGKNECAGICEEKAKPLFEKFEDKEMKKESPPPQAHETRAAILAQAQEAAGEQKEAMQELVAAQNHLRSLGARFAKKAEAMVRSGDKKQGAAAMAAVRQLDNLNSQIDMHLSNVAKFKGMVEKQEAAPAPSFLQKASIRMHRHKAPEDDLAKEMTHDLEMNFNKIAPFGKEDTAKELQDHAAKTQDTLVDAVENAEVAEIKRAVFRALTRLRAATIKEFDTIARLETQAIDAYNDAHHYRAENPLAHLHEDEAPVETDKLKSFH